MNMYGTWTQAARLARTTNIQPFMRVLPPPAPAPTPRYSVRNRILTEKGYATIMGVMTLQPKGDGRRIEDKEPVSLYDVWFDNGEYWLIREDDLVLEVVWWAQDTAANLSPVPTEPTAA